MRKLKISQTLKARVVLKSLNLHLHQKNVLSSLVYRLSFKGLVSDETTVDMKGTLTGGFGIAICDETDILLHERKESLNGAMINREEVEIIALITGLKDSIQLEFRNVMICCDDHQIFQIVSVFSLLIFS